MSTTKSFPEKGVMCHRTGFAKSCQECVVEHGCQLWVHLKGIDKDSGGPIDLYGCSDSFGPKIATQSAAQLTQMLEMVAKGIDHLRLEVQGENIKPMLQGIQKLNGKLEEVRRLGAPVDPVKLIGSD